ncbi:MAG: hypothetical protein M9929_00565 [Burkholderiaceae bacterium]|nr:hypothetical protein [Burkholderiaceae bacterium]
MSYVDRQTWSDFLNWGGIAATGWTATLDALGKGLDKLGVAERYEKATQLFAEHYRREADKAAQWLNAETRGPIAKAYAEKVYSEAIANANRLSDNHVSAVERLQFNTGRVGSALAQFPNLAQHIGPVFDWVQVADAAATGDLAGVYGNLAQIVAAEATAVLVAAGLTTAVAAGVLTIPVWGIALVAGGAAALVAFLGSSKGFDFFGDFGKWLEPYARSFGDLIEEKTGIRELISKFLLGNPDPLVKDIKYVMVDPLVLDLDGDGLEITPLSQGVQFDGNGDAIRTATSWIDADDGLLVLDRNGNGVIDSGRELFGDETLLADGTKAAHGFAALAELDVGGAANATGGAGDGVFDAKDAQYTSVRIWRDLNQDGISQANELQTLVEAGIASIKLDSTKTETNYGDAQLVQSGSFTRADGSEGQAGSFILAQNNAVTTHAPIAISTQEEEATAVLMAMGAAFTALPGHQRCRPKAREQRNLGSGPRGRTWPSSWRRFPSQGTAR